MAETACRTLLYDEGERRSDKLVNEKSIIDLFQYNRVEDSCRQRAIADDAGPCPRPRLACGVPSCRSAVAHFIVAWGHPPLTGVVNPVFGLSTMDAGSGCEGAVASSRLPWPWTSPAESGATR